MSKPVIFVAVLLIAAVHLNSCTSSKNKAAALRSVEEFHSRYNNFAFLDIYENSHPNLKKLISKEDFLYSIEAMRKGEGAVLKSQELGVAYHYSSEGDMVKILMDVTFEKGKSQEEFIYCITNDKAVLASYKFIPASPDRKD